MKLMADGAFGSQESIGYTLYYATNFIFTGLAIYMTHKPRKAVAPLTMPTQVPAE